MHNQNCSASYCAPVVFKNFSYLIHNKNIESVNKTIIYIYIYTFRF
jgi:hypothetical protein